MLDLWTRFENRLEELNEVERVDFLVAILHSFLDNAELDYENLVLKLEKMKNLSQVQEMAKAILDRDDSLREEIIDKIDLYQRNQTILPVELRDCQEEGIAKIADFICEGRLRGYISHPTGAGKTILFSSLIKICGLKTIVIAPSKQIAVQILRELRKFLPEEKISYLFSTNEKVLEGVAEKGVDGHVIVVVSNSFVMEKNYKKLLETNIDLVIWDECHRSYSKKCQNVLGYFGTAVKIGFSATPDYIYSKNKKGLQEIKIDDKIIYIDPEKSAEKYYCHLIDKIDLREAIMRRMLSPIAAAIIRVNINLDGINVISTLNGNDYNSKQLNTVLRGNWEIMEDAVLNCLRDGIGHETRIDKEQIFIVCSLVEHAQCLAKSLSSAGFIAECVVGSTKDSERQDILNRFRSKKTQILTSVEVLKEGWDAPEATVCFMLRPTLSRVLYQQVIGRVLRRDPDNPSKVALVVDFLGKYSKMAPLTTPTLFGITNIRQGEMIIPPGKDGKTSDKYPEIFNPFLVDQELIEIEVFDQRIERTGPGAILADGELFLSLNTIQKVFGIKDQLWRLVMDTENISSIEYNGCEYFPVQKVIREIHKKLKVSCDGREHRFLTLEKISDIFGIKKFFLRRSLKYCTYFRVENISEPQIHGDSFVFRERQVQIFSLGRSIIVLFQEFKRIMNTFLKQDSEEVKKPKNKSLPSKTGVRVPVDQTRPPVDEQEKLAEDNLAKLIKITEGFFSVCPICRKAWERDSYTQEAFCVECSKGSPKKKVRRRGAIFTLKYGNQVVAIIFPGTHSIKNKIFSAIVRKINKKAVIVGDIDFGKITKIEN